MKITHNHTDCCSINIGQTTKFKTIKIQVAFQQLFTDEAVTKRAIIPYLLRAISKTYPTRIIMQKKLEELYAASFVSGVHKIGLTQEIVFDLHIIHADYATDSDNLLAEAFQFLHDILFQPKFDQTIFKEEIRLIDEYFLGLYGNKMRYAIKETQQIMYENDRYQLDAMGKHEALPDITLEDVILAYNDMIHGDHITINVVGDVSVDEITDLVQSYLPFSNRSTPVHVLDTIKPVTKPQHIVTKQDVKQGKLVFGYRFPAYYLTEEYYSAVVVNMMFGGGPDSLLFKRMRDDNNMVYFIGSSYDQYKGSMFVYAGIDADNYDLVLTETTKIIDDLMKGNFSDKALTIAKKGLIQNLIESMDSISSITSRINHLALFGKTHDQDRLIRKVEAVTKEDIIRIANLLELHTTYLLRGEQDA